MHPLNKKYALPPASEVRFSADAGQPGKSAKRVFSRGSRGVTLVELVVATAIMSIGVLGFFFSFRTITTALHISRSRTLATNLAQEKIEKLKNLGYYQLLLSTATGADSRFTPSIVYDNGNYGPETITVGGITFTRYTLVNMAQLSGDSISTVTWTYPDTGLKQIAVNVVWTDNGTGKKFGLVNLLENPDLNPLDASLTGKIYSSVTSAPLPSAIVQIEENPAWNTTTDAGGTYSFSVFHGSYTIRASSQGFFDGESALMSVAAGSYGQTVNPSTMYLTPIGTGTVAGNVWISSHIVISQVVVSTIQAPTSFDAQYVELYNPTTTQVNIADAGGNPIFNLNYQSGAAPNSCPNIPLIYTSTYVMPSHYYLISNTTTVTINGTSVASDARYTSTANSVCSSAVPGWSYPTSMSIMQTNHSGSLLLTNGTGEPADSVGWTRGATTPNYCEVNCISFTNGFPQGEQIVRISSPMASLTVSDMLTYGHAYDSNNNQADFYYPNPPTSYGIQFTPGDTLNTPRSPIAGVPGIGSYVSASDPYSGSTQAYTAYITSGAYNLAYAPFNLVGVGTGTWFVDIASGSWYTEYSTVVVNQSSITWVPNSVSSPAWITANVYSAMLATSTLGGFVKGIISDINGKALNNVTLSVGGVLKTTSANGTYFVQTSSGPISIIAPNTATTGYVQQIALPTIYTGLITTQDFVLVQGGSITGYATTGTTPLPNLVVTANLGGSQYGTATTNSSGIFTIFVPTGTYTVKPAIDPSMAYTPDPPPTATVTSGASVSVGTFTVTSAMGAISGTVTDIGSLVTSGALLVASSATIDSTPPSIAASSAPALSNPVYAVSSLADGTYTLPVRGGYTYYLSVYVPIVNADGSVSISTKSYSGISVGVSATTTKNLTIP